MRERVHAVFAGEPFAWQGERDKFAFRTGVHDRRKVITLDGKRPFLDLTEVCELGPDQAGCLVTAIEVHATRTWRVRLEAQGEVALYVGDQRVSDQDRLTLPAGRHLFYVDGAGGDASQPNRLLVDLLPSDEIAAKRRAWAEQIALHGDVLARIVAHLPGSAEAERAQALLDAADAERAGR